MSSRIRETLNVASFEAYFDVMEATTPELLDQVFRLRYQVYCVENRFEDPSQHPQERETDAYDRHSRHIGLMYRPSKKLIGGARLILGVRCGTQPLPLESVIDRAARAELRRYPADEVGEISRYAVSKEFRRRRGEEEVADVGWKSSQAADCRRLMPHLTLGLMRGILALSLSSQVRFLCACMRPALLRLLEEFGLEFRPIGNAVLYHGLRQPCIAERDDLLSGLTGRNQEHSNLVTQPLTTPALVSAGGVLQERPPARTCL